jgi:crotonobetainyl-CoA:carnitine CoA-transferase CaiB-like acyl-CoA transferase
MTEAILKGIRVIEFGTGAAMPDMGRVLGAFGADIIHVEGRSPYDYMRDLTPGRTVNENPGFNDSNRNKRGIVVNLKERKGQELALELVRRCDVVLENFRADVMGKWGLDYESVRKVKPDIVYLSTQGWGGGGPYSGFTSYGPHAPSAGGLLYMWNYFDVDHPGGVALNHPDHIAAKLGLIPLIAALDYRRRTGKGQHIDLAQVEVGAGLIGDNYLEYTVNKQYPLPLGNRSPHAAPHGIYKCRGTVQRADNSPAEEDRWIAISVFTDHEWRGFCDAIGSPAWTGDPKFATLANRKENEDELDSLVEDWTRTQDRWDAMRMLQAAGVAAGVAAWPDDHIFCDPHLKARGFVIELDHPAAGKTLHVSEPVRLSGTPALPSTPAPMLDQHTDEVLTDILGMGRSQIAELRDEGVIGI